MLILGIAVRSCYFCADHESICRQNDRAREPNTMDCNNFHVNRNENPKDYIKEPKWLRNYTSIMLYGVLQKKRDIETQCISINYKLSNTSTNVNVTVTMYHVAYCL